jgi:hypothetical protein
MLDEVVVQGTYLVRQFDPESLEKVVFVPRENLRKQVARAAEFRGHVS